MRNTQCRSAIPAWQSSGTSTGSVAIGHSQTMKLLLPMQCCFESKNSSQAICEFAGCTPVQYEPA